MIHSLNFPFYVEKFGYLEDFMIAFCRYDMHYFKSFRQRGSFKIHIKFRF
jgi:hypothetical protein